MNGPGDTVHSIKWDKLISVPLTQNNSDRGIGELGEYHPLAYSFLSSLHWHSGIVENYFGGGVEEFAAAFLFEIVSDNPDVDTFLWVLVGNIPAVYLVTECAPDWVNAFNVYRKLALEWLNASNDDREAELVFPFHKTAGAVTNFELTAIVEKIETEVLKPHASDILQFE